MEEKCYNFIKPKIMIGLNLKNEGYVRWTRFSWSISFEQEIKIKYENIRRKYDIYALMFLNLYLN